MNKTQLIENVAAEADLSHAAAERAVTAVMDSIEGALKAGDAVQLVGWGSFTPRDRAARTGRNPRTGKPMQIPASRTAAFKPGVRLRDLPKA